MDDVTKPNLSATPATPKPVTSDSVTPSIAERLSIPVSHDTTTTPSLPNGPSDDVIKRTAPIVQPIHDDIVPPSPAVKSLADLDEPTPTDDEPAGSPELTTPDLSDDSNASAVADSKPFESPTPAVTSAPTPPASAESAMPMPADDTEAAIDPAIEEKSSEVPVEPTPAAVEEPKFEGKVTPASTERPSAQKGRGVVILVAVIIALALVGGAAYAYLQNKKATSKATSTSTPTVTTPTKNPATAKDVANSSSALDASLKKVDDTKDYQASDLSDTTLGL